MLVCYRAISQVDRISPMEPPFHMRCLRFAVMPEIVDTVRGNRRFLARAVTFLRDAGIR
jgi:hypothetical protein